MCAALTTFNTEDGRLRGKGVEKVKEDCALRLQWVNAEKRKKG